MSTYLQMPSELYCYNCSRVTYINYNKNFCMASPEAVVQRCCVQKLLLKLRTELTGKYQCRSLFNKVAGLQTCNFIKKRLQDSCFPVNVAKFLRTAFHGTTPVAASAKFDKVDRQTISSRQ